MRIHIGLAVALSVLAYTFPARADSVVVGAAKDNTVYAEDSTLSNGAGEHVFAGTNGAGNPRRAFMAFDIAAAVPAGATVDSVFLTLTLSQTSAGAGVQPVSLHRVLADWGEGTTDAPGNEGGGGPASGGDATWTFRFYSSIPWSSAGGDIDSMASATRTVNAVGVYTWTSAGMRGDVQAWLDAPSANFGWALIGNESTSQTAKRFDSRQRTIVGARPQLTIHYTLAPTGVARSSGAVARLLPAVPNPFNPTITVRFVMSRGGQVTLTIHDAGGRLVRTLVAGSQNDGAHDVTWNGRNSLGATVGSGVYFVRLAVEGAPPQTQKIVLLK